MENFARIIYMKNYEMFCSVWWKYIEMYNTSIHYENALQVGVSKGDGNNRWDRFCTHPSV